MSQAKREGSYKNSFELSAGKLSAQPSIRAYSPYGYISVSLANLLDFNGERLDPVTATYFLGNGHRMFAPNLMRFISPDHMSPFDKGGINSYNYCLCDPVNLKDPSGRGAEKSLSRMALGRLVVPPDYSPNQHRSRSLQRSQSMPLLVGRRLENDPPRGWKKIGYHGGLFKYAESLEAGINPKFLGALRPQDFGEGFYTAPSANRAASYARSTASAFRQQPQLYEVFAPGFSRLRPGRDYSLTLQKSSVLSMPVSGRRGDSLDLMEIVIRPSAYSRIEVRMARLRGEAELPPPHEAPF